MELTERVLDNTLVVDIAGSLDTQTAGAAMDALQVFLSTSRGWIS